jgi:hypothetical protein
MKRINNFFMCAALLGSFTLLRSNPVISYGAVKNNLDSLVEHFFEGASYPADRKRNLVVNFPVDLINKHCIGSCCDAEGIMQEVLNYIVQDVKNLAKDNARAIVNLHEYLTSHQKTDIVFEVGKQIENEINNVALGYPGGYQRFLKGAHLDDIVARKVDSAIDQATRPVAPSTWFILNWWWGR